jgi:hypothetical protein
MLRVCRSSVSAISDAGESFPKTLLLTVSLSKPPSMYYRIIAPCGTRKANSSSGTRKQTPTEAKRPVRSIYINRAAQSEHKTRPHAQPVVCKCFQPWQLDRLARRVACLAARLLKRQRERQLLKESVISQHRMFHACNQFSEPASSMSNIISSSSNCAIFVRCYLAYPCI